MGLVGFILMLCSFRGPLGIRRGFLYLVGVFFWIILGECVSLVLDFPVF